MKEKAASYARVPESTWSKDKRKEVAKLKPGDIKKNVNGTETAMSGGVEYRGEEGVWVGYDAPKAGTVSFFGE